MMDNPGHFRCRISSFPFYYILRSVLLKPNVYTQTTLLHYLLNYITLHPPACIFIMVCMEWISMQATLPHNVCQLGLHRIKTVNVHIYCDFITETRFWLLNLKQLLHSAIQAQMIQKNILWLVRWPFFIAKKHKFT